MNTPPAEQPPPDCTCPNPWTNLVTVVEGRRLRAHPATTPGPASALYIAHCARCGARYPGPWRLAPTEPRSPEGTFGPDTGPRRKRPHADPDNLPREG